LQAVEAARAAGLIGAFHGNGNGTEH